jgi:hypothetical protein
MISLAFALALVTKAQAWQPPRCEVGDATLHRAWDAVFASFPDRLTDDAEGYIAVTDCSQMGQLRRLWMGGRWWRVRIADCRNPKHAAVPGWLVDVDSRIWAATHTPITPTKIVLCTGAAD